MSKVSSVPVQWLTKWRPAERCLRVAVGCRREQPLDTRFCFTSGVTARPTTAPESHDAALLAGLHIDICIQRRRTREG